MFTVDKADYIATLWLDRPEKLNAMGATFWEELPSVMSDLDADDDIRVVVLAGKGAAFSAGLDLVEFGPAMASGMFGEGDGSAAGRAKSQLDQIKHMQTAITSVADCSKPVIAAIHGYCIGGGVDLITAADIRLASSDAVFSVRETKMAMVADVGTLQRLPRIVDRGWVAELAFTGRDVDAAEALEMKLVTHLYTDADELHHKAHELAADIAANSPLVVQGVKAVLRATEDSSVAEALDYGALWNAAFLASNDLGEAISAFMEKRPPDFGGD
ncbi:MAG: crotonase/enoyl-CoA hydratase family protein [Acidimicrobiia bacterium]|nr:crotonase/enoyl-CoA hydratase family protein [Acidimicrobiia bacterium]